MTLPTGTITIDDIRTEYSLSGVLSLGQLYAGGSIIAAGAGGINGPIPSSGAISLNNFKGHSAPPSVLSSVEVQPAAKYSDNMLVVGVIAMKLFFMALVKHIPILTAVLLVAIIAIWLALLKQTQLRVVL